MKQNIVYMNRLSGGGGGFVLGQCSWYSVAVFMENFRSVGSDILHTYIQAHPHTCCISQFNSPKREKWTETRWLPAGARPWEVCPGPWLPRSSEGAGVTLCPELRKQLNPCRTTALWHSVLCHQARITYTDHLCASIGRHTYEIWSFLVLEPDLTAHRPPSSCM